MTLQDFTYPVGALSHQGERCREALVGDVLTLQVAPNPNVAVRLQRLTALALIEQPRGSDLQCSLIDGIGTLGPFTVPGVVRLTFDYLNTTSTAYIICYPLEAIRHPHICPGRPMASIRNTLRAIARETILDNARRIFTKGERWDTGDLIVHSDPRSIPEFINFRPYVGN